MTTSDHRLAITVLDLFAWIGFAVALCLTTDGIAIGSVSRFEGGIFVGILACCWGLGCWIADRIFRPQ